MTDRLMVFEQQDEAGASTGQTLSMDKVEFTPLTYSELMGLKLSGKIAVSLCWKDATIVASNFAGLTPSQVISGNTWVESPYSSKALGLVKGGWLPSGLALTTGMVILPDRCIVSELQSRFHGGVKKEGQGKDFLDFFDTPGILINPLLFALEGNARSHLGPTAVKQQLKEASSKLQTALPAAKLVPDSAGGLAGVLGLAEETQAGISKKRAFLLELAPLLAPAIGAKKRGQLWEAVLLAAKRHGVPANSLVVIAALSAVMNPMNANPGKRLLKFAPNYSDGDAYNALSDIRALELLMALFSLFPTQPLMLCTSDKNMALFWAGLRASNFHIADGKIHYSLDPETDLLPGLNADQRMQIFGAQQD